MSKRTVNRERLFRTDKFPQKGDEVVFHAGMHHVYDYHKDCWKSDHIKKHFLPCAYAQTHTVALIGTQLSLSRRGLIVYHIISYHIFAFHKLWQTQSRLVHEVTTKFIYRWQTARRICTCKCNGVADLVKTRSVPFKSIRQPGAVLYHSRPALCLVDLLPWILYSTGLRPGLFSGHKSGTS